MYTSEIATLSHVRKKIFPLQCCASPVLLTASFALLCFSYNQLTAIVADTFRIPNYWSSATSFLCRNSKPETQTRFRLSSNVTIASSMPHPYTFFHPPLTPRPYPL